MRVLQCITAAALLTAAGAQAQPSAAIAPALQKECDALAAAPATSREWTERWIFAASPEISPRRVK
jgi:hypothetical protein